jgi:hypothetical protein
MLSRTTATLAVAFVLASSSLAGCGGSDGPSAATLKSEETAAFEKRLAARRDELLSSGLGGDAAERLARSTARLAAGKRAYELLHGGQEDRGRAAARAAGFDPEELADTDPAEFAP